MGDNKNLYSKEAIEKLKELAEAADICMFVTNLDNRPMSARPMSTQEVDEEGNLWFLSKASSDKNEEIKDNDEVQLFYNNKTSAEFLSVYGRAVIMRDREKTKEIWTPMAKAWFTEGIDDPELTIIKVIPEDTYYWDTKSSKFVSLVKIAAAVVTGKTKDDGVQGKINVH